jgi:hypothetical protein
LRKLEYVIRNGRRIEVETLPSRVAPKQRQHRGQHTGCSLEWLKRVLPIVKTKQQLAVAIWLQRRRAICRSEVFTIPTEKLRLDLGLSRKIKSQTLQRLEEAGIIVINRDGKRALQVRIL